MTSTILFSENLSNEPADRLRDTLEVLISRGESLLVQIKSVSGQPDQVLSLSKQVIETLQEQQRLLLEMLELWEISGRMLRLIRDQ